MNIQMIGKRITLREWGEGEEEDMNRWYSHPQVKRYLSWGGNSMQDSSEHLQLCLREQEKDKRRRYYLAIELNTTKMIIGDAGFEWIGETLGCKEGEMGCFLIPEYWGNGYGVEAARLVLELAFDRMEAEAVWASCDERNTASEKLMKRCGMLRNISKETEGRRLYQITKSQWSAIKK